jgi:hypothetical protein
MKKTFALAAVLALCVGTTARAADSLEKVIKDSLALMKKATTILKTIKDKDSAKAATPKLKDIQKEGKKLQARQKKLPKPTPEEAMGLVKYLKQIKEVQTSLQKEVERVKKVPGGKEALKAADLDKKKGPPKKDG